MKTSFTPSNLSIADNGFANACLASLFGKHDSFLEEEVLDYSTIDGGVIASNTGRSAVDSGAGIFIGDYFVGVIDSFISSCNIPYVRY